MPAPVTSTSVSFGHKRPYFQKYKSYDETIGKPLGLVYAAHNPAIAETLDRLELLISLRFLYGDELAIALVSAFNKIYPSISHNKKNFKPSFKQWNRLANEIRPAMYSEGSIDQSIPLTHALTIHLPDELVQYEYTKNLSNGRTNGPAKIIGTDFLNRHLYKPYQRAGLLDEFNYIYVVEAKPLYRHNDFKNKHDKRLGRDTLVSFHATIAINIPASMFEKISKRIKDWAGMDPSQAFRKNSGQLAYLQEISSSRMFKTGKDATKRSGVIGLIDYACKGLRYSFSYSQDYQRLNSTPLPMSKVSSASSNIRIAAENYYETLKNMMKVPADKALAQAKSATIHSKFHSMDPLIIEAKQTIKRIAASDDKYDLKSLLQDGSPDKIISAIEVELRKL